MSEETYNGWTNRETWAVALHINNDQGWQESVHEAIREAMPLACPDCGAMNSTRDHEGFLDCHECGAAWMPRAGAAAERKAGDIIRENVEEALDFEDPSSRSFERIQIAQEIGSLWRVDWLELGTSFLSDLEDN